MSGSARSVFVFGIYLVVIGVGLLVVPNVLLGVFMLPPTSEVWVRVVGMITLFLSVYCIMAARGEVTEFFRWTVYTRSTTILFLLAFVVSGLASPYLLPFGVVDLLGAAWTAMALRSAKTA